MSQINNYPIVVDFENATFVVETESGTRRLNFSQIAEYFNNIVNDGGIGEAKTKAAEALEAALAASYTANDAVERIDDIIQKNIATAYIQNRHLYIQLVDDTRVDCGIIIEGKEYGVCYDADTQSPILERVGDAVGLNAGIGVGNDTDIINDFDNIYPWSDMRRCTISNDGVVTSYKGDVNYVEDGSIGQVMVEIPKFYIKRVTDDSNKKVYTYIAGEQLSGYRLPEAFKDINGNEMDYIYLAAYPSVNDGSDTMTNSITTKKIMSTKYDRYAAIMNYSLKRGEGWHNLSVAEITDVIQPLFIVEFATLNTSEVFPGCVGMNYDYWVVDESSLGTGKNSVITKGYGDTTSDITPFEDEDLYVGMPIEIALSYDEKDYVMQPLDSIVGEGDEAYIITIRKVTDIVKNDETGLFTITFDGAPIIIDTDVTFNITKYNGICNDIQASSCAIGYGYTPFIWRGFENLFNYDNVWVGGIIYDLTNDDYYHYNPDLTQQNSIGDKVEPFVQTDVAAPTAVGYITRMGDSDEYPCIWLPTETGGISDTSYCDEFKKYGTSVRARALLWGGSGVFGFASSLFNSSTSACGRLAYNRFRGGVGETSPTQ